MTEPTPATEQPQQQPQQPAETPPPPPWGDDFDPARAWHTIQTLRERERDLSKRQITPEMQQQLDEYGRLVEASKSDAQRLQEAADLARREAETARAEATRYKVAATHGIPADHFDLLGSGSEDEIAARAQKLASLIAAQSAPQQPTKPPTRPVEQMRPGATPGEAQSEEDVIYAQLFGR